MGPYLDGVGARGDCKPNRLAHWCRSNPDTVNEDSPSHAEQAVVYGTLTRHLNCTLAVLGELGRSHLAIVAFDAI